jgi:hypothetical protein
MIYIELMGNRRVRIEHSWMLPSPFQAKIEARRQALGLVARCLSEKRFFHPE